MNPLSAASLAVPSRPDPRHVLIEVVVGDEALTAECTVTGRYHAAVTQADPDHCHPEEWPEIEVVRLWTADLKRDLTGLMEFSPLAERVQEQCEEYVLNDGPDPDEAYERSREERVS